MKVLLDHNLPHKLRTSLAPLTQHEIITASHMRWGGLKNGALLKELENRGFQAFVTGDQTLRFEQNLTTTNLALIALSANNWPIIKNHLAKILAAIDNATPGSFQFVDCGAFSRTKPAREE